jgi:hypothetical protein
MKKLFLAGHSDSGAAYLPPGVLPWPERTRRSLEVLTGEPWELVEVRFAPIGPRAVDYLAGKIEAAQPDIVILPFTAYLCAVGSVEESIRQRFGERPARWFRSVEHPFQQRTRDGGTVARRANRKGRTLGRRLLGARPPATVEQTAAIYEEVLHRLARMESVQVLAIEDARFSAEIQAREPKLHQRIDALYARILPVARSHHFAIANVEGALRAAPDRSVFHQPDGVHTTAAFHDLFFSVIDKALSEVLSEAPK